MMAVIAGGSHRQEPPAGSHHHDPAGLRQLQGIDIAIDNSTGKIVGVCLWNTPESHEGSFANELKQFGAYYKALSLQTLLRAIGTCSSTAPRTSTGTSSTSVFSEYRGCGIGSQHSIGTERIGDTPPTSRRQPTTARLYERSGFFSLGHSRHLLQAPSA